MKKIILPVALFVSILTNAQDSTYNQKSIDFGVGVANILTPGSSVGFDGKRLDPLSLNLGYRKMFNREIGISANLGYNNFSSENSKLKVNTNFFSFTLNAVLNVRSILNFNEFLSNYGLLAHFGAGAVANVTSPNLTLAGVKRDLGIVGTAGITPQYRINDKLALNLDLTLNVVKYHQLALDMQTYQDEGLGKLFGTATIGFNYYLGANGKTHADWAPRFDRTAAEIEALKNRVKQVENKLTDSDKDGVADYLDLEPNTPEGSVVNTHGQKVSDTDGDGIEDSQDYCPTVKGTSEFKGCPTAVGSSSSTSISEGKEVEGQIKYDIAKYTTDINFQTKSTNIKNSSKKQLDELAKILSSNPNLFINLTGHCDNIGEDILNNQLSLDRANSVKDYLIGKGVSSSKINTKGLGTTKPKQSNDTEKGRSANRRVEFEVKTK